MTKLCPVCLPYVYLIVLLVMCFCVPAFLLSLVCVVVSRSYTTLGRGVRDAHRGLNEQITGPSVLQHFQEQEHQLGFPGDSSGMAYIYFNRSLVVYIYHAGFERVHAQL